MKTILITVVLLIFATPAFAQNTQRGLREHLISPKHILKAQQALKLTKTQKLALKEALKKAQASNIDLEFELQSEVEKLKKLVEPQKINLSKAEAQAKKVMELESKIKLTQLRLAITTKNLLNAAQLKKAMKIAAKRRGDRREKMRDRKRDRDN